MLKTTLMLISISLSASAFAVCPLCAFTVGAGIGLTQYCGIDDTVSGIWIGGFIISLVVLTNDWLRHKNFSFFGYKMITSIFYYASILIPLYFMGCFGHELNQLWGMDRLILGITIGSIAVWLSAITYEKLKKYNSNHAYFPFQKIVMPIGISIILSIIFYFITR